MRPIPPRTLWLALLVVVVVPAPAEAHLVSTGLGPLSDGLGHFALSPEDFIPVIALSLFAGLRGERTAANALFAFPVAWLAGGVFGLILRWAPAFPWAGVVCFAVGASVAADLVLGPFFVTALACILGLLFGYLNGVAFAAASGGLLAVFGSGVAGFILIALLSTGVVSLRRPWTRIAVRVAGSWIAAIGLLLVGWFLHAPHAP
jgi:hypothetical protein